MQLENAQVTLATPTAAVLAQMSGISGVAAAEPSLQLPVTIGTGQDAYATALVGFIPGTTMHEFLSPVGGHEALPESRLLLGVDLQGRLHLSTGGHVAAQVPGQKRADVEVAGYADEPLGTFACASVDQVARLAPGIPASNRDAGLRPPARTGPRFRRCPASSPTRIPRRPAPPGELVHEPVLRLRRDHARVQWPARLRHPVRDHVGANLSERTAEVGNLRASGVSRGRLAGVITEENMLLAVVGVVAMASFNSDLFRFETAISWSTYVISAAAVVAAALVALGPACARSPASTSAASSANGPADDGQGVRGGDVPASAQTWRWPGARSLSWSTSDAGPADTAGVHLTGRRRRPARRGHGHAPGQRPVFRHDDHRKPGDQEALSTALARVMPPKGPRSLAGRPASSPYRESALLGSFAIGRRHPWRRRRGIGGFTGAMCYHGAVSDPVNPYLFLPGEGDMFRSPASGPRPVQSACAEHERGVHGRQGRRP